MNIHINCKLRNKSFAIKIVLKHFCNLMLLSLYFRIFVRNAIFKEICSYVITLRSYTEPCQMRAIM